MFSVCVLPFPPCLVFGVLFCYLVLAVELAILRLPGGHRATEPCPWPFCFYFCCLLCFDLK